VQGDRGHSLSASLLGGLVPLLRDLRVSPGEAHMRGRLAQVLIGGGDIA